MIPLVYALPGNEAFVGRLGAAMALEQGALDVHCFPDGETRVRFDTMPDGRDAVIVSTLRNPDPQLFPLLCAAATARELGARSVGLVAPYLAYLRQDARFHPGEALSAVHFTRLLNMHFDWLVTVDPHLHRVRTLDELFTIRAQPVSAAQTIAEWIRAHVKVPLIVGPDAESWQWAERVAAGVEAPWIVLDKQRSGDRDVAVTAPDLGAFRDHTPVLVDDIISSGHTLIAAAQQLLVQGLKAPLCAATHGVFAEGAYEALLATGITEVVTADTIAHPSNGVGVAGVIAEAVLRMLERPG